MKDQSVISGRLDSYGAFYSHVRKRATKVTKGSLVCSKCVDKKVLDCGFVGHDWAREGSDAWLHKMIAATARTVVGMDLLFDDLKSLRKTGRYQNLVCADAQALPFVDDHFDVVVVGDLIEHVSNPGQMLGSIRRCLADDGELVVTTPNPFYVNQFLSIVASNGVTVNDEHTCWFDPVTLFALLQRTGFRVTEFYWLQDTWGRWSMASLFRQGDSIKRKLRNLLWAPVYGALGSLRLLRYVRGYLSSDFAIVAKKVRS